MMHSLPTADARVTVEVETAPDFDALGEALRSALKGSDNEALCKAVSAICACCEPGDMGEDDAED